ncbi:MAG: heavy metal-binding domain-containing protein [Spirochaetota bacterium]
MEYKCPMNCEGAKTYSKPGKCPKCGMTLVPISEGEKKEGEPDHHDHGHTHHGGGHEALKTEDGGNNHEYASGMNYPGTAGTLCICGTEGCDGS